VAGGSWTHASYITEPLAPIWLQDIAALIEDAQGDKFLRELKLRWDNHNKSMHMIRDILMVSVTPATLPRLCYTVGVTCTGDGHLAMLLLC
jgi:hypothetical protein